MHAAAGDMFVRQNPHDPALAMTALRLIPVIDLMDGMVVHAREGRREECRPVRSRLTESAAPLDIAQALLELHPFKTLYIADLDAIARRGENRDSLLAIRQRFPQPGTLGGHRHRRPGRARALARSGAALGLT